jgi:hypothetical protein
MEIIKVNRGKKVIGTAAVSKVFGDIGSFAKAEARVGASGGIGKGGLARRRREERSNGIGNIGHGTCVAGNPLVWMDMVKRPGS